MGQIVHGVPEINSKIYKRRKIHLYFSSAGSSCLVEVDITNKQLEKYSEVITNSLRKHDFTCLVTPDVVGVLPGIGLPNDNNFQPIFSNPRQRDHSRCNLPPIGGKYTTCCLREWKLVSDFGC